MTSIEDLEARFKTAQAAADEHARAHAVTFEEQLQAGQLRQAAMEAGLLLAGARVAARVANGAP